MFFINEWNAFCHLELQNPAQFRNDVCTIPKVQSSVVQIWFHLGLRSSAKRRISNISNSINMIQGMKNLLSQFYLPFATVPFCHPSCPSVVFRFNWPAKNTGNICSRTFFLSFLSTTLLPDWAKAEGHTNVFMLKGTTCIRFVWNVVPFSTNTSIRSRFDLVRQLRGSEFDRANHSTENSMNQRRITIKGQQ